MQEKLFDDAKYGKLGILGGTFNPIHIGHLLLAEAAYDEIGLDGVMFLPSGNSYMKDASGILAAADRLEMTQLAVKGQPDFFVSDMEIKRGGNTYTYETLSTIKDLHPDTQLFFLTGADCLFSVENWRNPEQIFASCSFVTALRGDADEAKLNKQVQRLQERYDANIILLPFLKMEISSTAIRERIKQGKSVRYMVPEAVYQYLLEKQLYKMNL